MNQPIMPEMPTVKSITDDDESHEEPTPRYSVPNQGRNQDVDPKALAYLLRYETMMRQQEAEEMATSAHIQPLLSRIQELGKDTKKVSSYALDESALMEREVPYNVLKRALEALEASSEVMTTDKQLMMVLRTLTEKVSISEETISLAEFVQCYKTVVTGMQTLQHLPGESSVRSRARDRTLSILSLFEPPSTKLFNENSLTDVVEDNRALTGFPEPAEAVKSKRTKGRLVRVFSLFTFVLVACLLVFLYAPPSLRTDIKNLVHFRPTLAVDRPLSMSPTSASGNYPKPRDSDKITASSDPSRTNKHSTLDQTPHSWPTGSDQDTSVETLFKQHPSLGMAVKKRMIGSAFAGGAAGVAFAPTLWNTVRVMVSKVLSGIASVIPGANPPAVLAVISVGGLACFSGDSRKHLLGPFGEAPDRSHD